MGLFSLLSRKPNLSAGSTPANSVERWKGDVYALFQSAYGLEKEDVEEFVDEAVEQGFWKTVAPQRFVEHCADKYGFLSLE